MTPRPHGLTRQRANASLSTTWWPCFVATRPSRASSGGLWRPTSGVSAPPRPSRTVGTMPRSSTTARGAPRLPSVAWLPFSPPQPWIVWPSVLVPSVPSYGLQTASRCLPSIPADWSWLRAARSLSDRRGPSGEAPPVMFQGCVVLFVS